MYNQWLDVCNDQWRIRSSQSVITSVNTDANLFYLRRSDGSKPALLCLITNFDFNPYPFFLLNS